MVNQSNRYKQIHRPQTSAAATSDKIILTKPSDFNAMTSDMESKQKFASTAMDIKIDIVKERADSKKSSSSWRILELISLTVLVLGTVGLLVLFFCPRSEDATQRHAQPDEAVKCGPCGSKEACTKINDTYSQCTCKIGYHGIAPECKDVNECNSPTPHCHKLANCVNMQGSYTCRCKDGFYGNGINECADQDECLLGSLNKCHEKATCNNTHGSHSCTCQSGYHGDGHTCEDIDECAVGSNDCDDKAHCLNTDGSYICQCKAGYTGNGTTGNCVDIDECVLKTDRCHVNANCSNIIGSYNCSCQTGYRGNGSQCDDIDECQVHSHRCHKNGNCSNTAGSYNCACLVGFYGNGIQCADIDECGTESHDCHQNANCSNTEGSHNCSCQLGYHGDGYNCSDINECDTGLHDCHEKARCHNTAGSFSCSCSDSSSGDGKNCQASSQSLSEGAWVGIGIGITVFLIVVVLVLVFCCSKRKAADVFAVYSGTGRKRNW